MKRKLSLLMVLLMVISLVPMSAFAASDSIVNTVVTSSDATVDFEVSIEATGTGISSNGVFELRLDSDGEWDTLSVQGAPNASVQTLSGQRAEIKVYGSDIPAATGAAGRITLKGTVKLDGAKGEQKVTIEDIQSSGINRQVLTYAVVSGDGNVIIRTLQDSKTVNRGTDQKAAEFELRETTKDAMAASTVTGSTFTLRLPKDVKWVTSGLKKTQIKLNTTQVLNYTPSPDGRDLKVDLIGASDSIIDRIIVTPFLEITKDAKLGDINVQVLEGTSKIDVDDVKIATYKEFDVVLKVEEVKAIIAGKDNTTKEYQATITIDQTGNSLIPGRPIDFTVKGGDLALKSGPSYVDGISSYNDEFTVTVPSTINKGDIEFDVYLKADWDATGEITLTGKGAGMVEQTIKLADVMAPAKITTMMTKEKMVADVIVGLQEQMSPEIMLTETEAGSLSEGFYVFDFAAARYSGIEMIDSDVKYEVTGDLDVEDVYTIEKGSKLVVEVSGESSKEASTLTIKGLKVTLDRTVPFGNIDLRFGASVVKTGSNEGDMVDPEASSNYEVKDIVAKTPYLNVVTSVQDQRTQQTVFMIDSVTYMVGSETRTLDAAPFISMNRTMLPIGTVAQLVGATVNYSPASRTAVFVKDNLVVSMNLDTNVLLVNGSPVMMDAKPMIVNSRAFVPVVYVAQAFGIQNGTDIVYDAAMKTVTLFPEVK